MQIVNFVGLAQASAAELVWPFVDQQNQPFGSVDAAKLTIKARTPVTMTLGEGLSFSNSEIHADLTNERAENLSGNITYELWVQFGNDKIALVNGTMSFTPTTVRI